MTKEDIKEFEENLYFEDENNEVPPADIVAYNELRSCADLNRMYVQGILEIQPEFQREIVWAGTDQTRFIDSIVKQLPIPSLCFALDYNENKWLVIDGLQRISTIVRFLGEENWRLSKLDDIDPNLSGKLKKRFFEPKSSLARYGSRVENAVIPVNVLRCTFNKKSHMEYLFTIFHRLNSGGQKLNNQEIRNCIYSGELNALLKELDDNPLWRELHRMKEGQSLSFVKQEIILRFFALIDRPDKYQGKVSKFLNDYMYDNRNPGADFIEAKRRLFERTVDQLLGRVLGKSFDQKLPIAILEAALVGIGRNIDRVEQMKVAELRKKYKEMLDSESFSEEALAEGLSKKARVTERIEASIAAFSEA